MSLLTDQEIETIYMEQTGFDLDESPAALSDFARAVEAAVIKRLATVSVEPKPVNESGSTMTVTRWMAETPAGWIGSWDKDAIPTALAAARVQSLEEALKECEGTNMVSICMTRIRALIGGGN